MVTLQTLLPMACDGVGPSYTCTRLLNGMMAAGLPGRLYVDRTRVRLPGLTYVSAVPRPFGILPYRWLSGPASRRSEHSFLRALQPGDIAYLWPAASLDAYRKVRARGIPIIGEGINTRMAFARRILSEAYAAEGLAPAHDITDQRIEEEEEKLSMTTGIFAPNAGVEQSLAASAVAPGGVMRASYGVDLLAEPRPVRAAAGAGGPVFLFVGYGCIRKGLHLLLRAWERAQTGGILLLAGEIEPAVRRLCAPILARPDVRALGFVRNVRSLYARADVFVFPSLEEGGPLVTYEAAAYGLPIIASPMGGGRIGEETGCVLTVDPVATDTIATALHRLATSPEERAAWGRRSLEAVRDYSWSAVAARRVKLLQSLLASG